MKRFILTAVMVAMCSTDLFAGCLGGACGVRSVRVRRGLFARRSVRRDVVVVERVRQVQVIRQVQVVQQVVPVVQQVIAAPVFSTVFAAPVFAPAVYANPAVVPVAANASLEARLSTMEAALGRLQCVRNCLQ